MTPDDLYDALSGLHAYDSGCVSSGIHDELLRERAKTYLKGLDETALRLVLSRFVRDMYLMEEALSQRYGIEDVKDFIDWLDERMEIAL